MVKPAEHINWLTGNGSVSSVIEEPSAGLLLNGYEADDELASKNVNWLFYYVDQWNKWAETEIDILSAMSRASQWFTGSGAPLMASEETDMYLDIVSGNIYRYESAAWVLKVSIQGPAGADGADGVDGDDGDDLTLPVGAAGTVLKSNGTIYSWGQILNADIDSTAAIALTKLAALTASIVPVTDGSGKLASSAVTVTQLGYLSGVTGAIQTQINAKVSTSLVGAVSGIAELDGTGKVPTAQLPSYVDDVLEYANVAAFPVTGETGKIYVAIDTNVVYRWSGSIYAEISSTIALGETSASAYRGDRGKIAYDHSQLTSGNPHSVTKNEIGLGNVDNTSDATKNAAAVVLLNKDIDGGAASNSSRITVPSGTLAAITALTRKAGTILYATDTGKFYVDNGTVLTPADASSASGAGRVNYFANTGFETDVTTGVSTYKDAAAAIPVDGTGGTSTLTLTRTTSSPLNGTGSLQIAKPASNVQGEGVAFDCSVPVGYQSSRNCEFTLLIDTDVTGYVAGDFRLYIYDVTNSVLITPTVADIPKKRGDWTVSWVSSGTGAVYRAIIHCAATHTTAYNIKIDDVVVGPGLVSQSAAVSGTQPWATVLTGFGNAVAYLQYEQVGSNFVGRGTIIIGSTLPTTTMQFSLPAGLVADYSGFPKGATNSDSYQRVGYVSCFTGTGKSYFGAVQRFIASTTVFQVSGSGAVYGTNQDWAPAAPITWVAGDAIMISITVPIVGWNPNVNIGPGAQLEYGADDGTNDVFGPNGAAVPAIVLGTGVTQRSFTFQNAPQASNFYSLEIQLTGTTTFIPAHGRYNFIRTSASDYYGVGFEVSSVNLFTVNFGNRGAEASAGIGSNGAAWTAVSRFRLAKARPDSPIGFGMANSLESGLVKPRKGQYGLTATSTAAGWSTIRAQGIYYQDQDGNHRLKFNVSGSFTSKTLTTDTLTLTGVVFKNVTNFEQPVTAFNNGSLPNTYAATVTNTANVQYGAASSTSATRVNFSGDVELESKPSWA